MDGDTRWPDAHSVTLVGGGVVNLVCAHALVEAGFEVEIVDAGADPRTAADWRTQGATAAGENARMFCLTEADNYNEKGDSVYTDMLTAFERRIEHGGWLVDCVGSRSPGFATWCRRFAAVPPWKAKIFADDIYEFNRASASLWARMRRRHPDLFTEVGLVDGVVRLYSDAEAFDAACDKQHRVGALQQMLSPDQLARDHPALAAACADGEIAGALEVVGFTLNIHDFVAKLLTWLEDHGTRLTWGVRARWLRHRRKVVGLDLEDGTTRRSHHYVASPGAYGSELFEDTRCAGTLAGIAGLWMTLPNLEPRLRHSLKIHREGHCGEDSNVTLARDTEGREILVLGSGYAVIGDQCSLDLDSSDIQSLYDALEVTVRRFFPRHHQLGPGTGFMISRRACVRPFTATGLGLFDGLAALEGLALLTGGHNTGGFAQAPMIAASVVDTLNGRRCPMQLKYSPDRGIE